MLSQFSSGFIGRLRSKDPAAWYDLWETFGPVLRAQLTKWGRGRIGAETVRDLSQETMAALSDSIDRYDPARGARFSTWLLAIAKHALGDEMDRRNALKRGGGKKTASLDEAWMGQATNAKPDEAYEAAVFDAKVCAAIRLIEREVEFTDFSIFQMRLLEGRSGKDVALALGTSEPTVSRRLDKVRTLLRSRLAEVIATYSFTPEEAGEADRKGLSPDPNKARDALFDQAISEVYHREMERRREEELSGLGGV